jgi:hypothetical protein
MKRRALIVVVLAAVVAVSAYSLASGGSGTVQPALIVGSAGVSPTSAVKLSFRSAAPSGHLGALLVDYTLSVAGPVRSGCVGLHSEQLPAARKGAVASIKLTPAGLGGRWCAGTFTARVVETQRPFCKPGMMCPQFVRLIGTVAKTSFRVTG